MRCFFPPTPPEFAPSLRRIGGFGKNSMTTPHPRCSLCRDTTFATMSLQTHDDDPEWPWSHYCDPCGAAMASVLRDAQKREPVVQRLPEPPPAEAEPLKEPKAPKKKAAPKEPKPTPEPVKAPGPPPRRLTPPKAPESHDLLALLGMRR